MLQWLMCCLGCLPIVVIVKSVDVTVYSMVHALYPVGVVVLNAPLLQMCLHAYMS